MSLLFPSAVFFVAVLVVRFQAAAGTNLSIAVGKPECQCLGNRAFPSSSTYWDVNKTEIMAPTDRGLYRYSGLYGSSCHSWDVGTAPYCDIGSPPEWCAQPFCYVDPVKCDGASLYASSYFPSMYYSYASCTDGAEESSTGCK